MQNNNVTFGVLFDSSTYADCGNKIYVKLCYVMLCYKSCCVYFGPRYNADVDNLMLSNDKITCNSSFKYLGIHFVNGNSIGVNIEPIKHKFFMSCNNILSHSSDLCDLVQLQLHESYVLPTRMLQRQLIYLKRR